MKRKTLLFGLGIVAAAVSVSLMVWVTHQPEHRITGRTFANIEKGMTESEVEQILGVPAGNYTREAVATIYPLGANDLVAGNELVRKEGGKEWIGNHASIYVRFDGWNV